MTTAPQSRWRADRIQGDGAEWPDELHRGPVWPWDGYRHDGWRAVWTDTRRSA